MSKYTLLVVPFASHLFFNSVILHGSTIDLAKAQSRVEFLAKGTPSALTIRGKATGSEPFLLGQLNIEKNQLTGNATFSLQALDTGIELRNKHMKEKYLEVQKFPIAEYTSLKMALPATFDQTKSEAEGISFEGIFSLHGVKRPLSGTAKYSKDKDKVDMELQFTVSMKDFAIEMPNYLGIKVEDSVNSTVSIQFTLPNSDSVSNL